MQVAVDSCVCLYFLAPCENMTWPSSLFNRRLSGFPPRSKTPSSKGFSRSTHRKSVTQRTERLVVGSRAEGHCRPLESCASCDFFFKKKSVCVPLSLLLCLDYAGVEQLNEAYIRQLERDGKLESVYGKDATIIVPEKVWKR